MYQSDPLNVNDRVKVVGDNSGDVLTVVRILAGKYYGPLVTVADDDGNKFNYLKRDLQRT